ncbi:MAG: SoxR reducing system RseC family protein [Bacteroidales bacterium]|jgi:sigma-E factor negative regulatory protein RseC|nr:SoxR reducing system RseC family protein [Bacteroidales bacterium]
MSKIVTHKGKVIHLEGLDVRVMIESMSACAACHAKGMCTLSDKEDKIIDIKVSADRAAKLNVGDEVVVAVSQQRGMQAVLLAYILPAILVVLSLILLLKLLPEPLAILSALAVLGGYYYVLYLFRNKLNAKFIMSIVDC